MAVCSATLALTAHVAADGVLPHLSMALPLATLLGWLTALAADRTRGIAETALILGGAQLAMHWTLTGLTVHEGGTHYGLAMPATHAAATVLTALLLTRADSMLEAMAHALTARLPVLPADILPESAPPVQVAVCTTGCGHVVETLLSRVHGSRGPPKHS